MAVCQSLSVLTHAISGNSYLIKVCRSTSLPQHSSMQCFGASGPMPQGILSLYIASQQPENLPPINLVPPLTCCNCFSSH